MLKVYVAGKYSADNVVDVLKNIAKGEQRCAELFLAGYAPFCPWHDKGYILSYPNAEYTVKMFYDYCIEWLKVSDVMYVLPGWETSKGTRAEMNIADDLKIPIVFTEMDLKIIKDSL